MIVISETVFDKDYIESNIRITKNILKGAVINTDFDRSFYENKKDKLIILYEMLEMLKESNPEEFI